MAHSMLRSGKPVYFPFAQSADTDFNVVVRTSQSEASVLPTLVAAVHEADAEASERSERADHGQQDQ